MKTSLLRSPELFFCKQADISSVVVWMVLILPLILSLPSLFSRFSGTIPRASTIWGITITFMFHIFQLSSKIQAFIHIIHISTLWSTGTAKSTRYQVLIFLLIKTGLVNWHELGDPFVSQSPREFYAFHFLWQILVWCIYHGSL